LGKNVGKIERGDPGAVNLQNTKSIAAKLLGGRSLQGKFVLETWGKMGKRGQTFFCNKKIRLAAFKDTDNKEKPTPGGGKA